MTRWWRRLVSRLAAREISIASAKAFGSGWCAGYRAGTDSADHLVAFYRQWCEELLREKDAMTRRAD